MYEINNKVAVIIGGTRGTGLAIANGLLGQGAKVVVNGRHETSEPDELSRRYGEHQVPVALGDVSDPDSAADVATAAMELLRNDFIAGEYLTVAGGMSMRITA